MFRVSGPAAQSSSALTPVVATRMVPPTRSALTLPPAAEARPLASSRTGRRSSHLRAVVYRWQILRERRSFH